MNANTDKVDLLTKALNKIKAIPKVEAVAVGTPDGISLAGVMPKNIDQADMVAMSSTMLGAAQTVSAQCGKGVPIRVTVETPKGNLVVVSAGPKAILAMLFGPGANVDSLKDPINTAVNEIKHIMG